MRFRAWHPLRYQDRVKGTDIQSASGVHVRFCARPIQQLMDCEGDDIDNRLAMGMVTLRIKSEGKVAASMETPDS
ncbi:MAG: hypothetical protein ACR2NZ_13600 [Rubripirellula sp.]